MKMRRNRSRILKQQEPRAFKKARWLNYRKKRSLKTLTELPPINKLKVIIQEAYRYRGLTDQTGIRLLGVSQVGKNLATHRVLGLLDQASLNNTDQNQTASKTPRGWLKLDCPTGTTPRSLYVNFFTILDELLGNT